MNTKHYTSVEMSKKLLELGMSPETADMLYTSLDGHTTPWVWTSKPGIHSCDIPCWSLGALLELIDCIITEDEGLFSFILWNHYNGWSIQCELLNYNHSCNTPLEAAYNMVVWLLKNKYIK